MTVALHFPRKLIFGLKLTERIGKAVEIKWIVTSAASVRSLQIHIHYPDVGNDN